MRLQCWAVIGRKISRCSDFCHTIVGRHDGMKLEGLGLILSFLVSFSTFPISRYSFSQEIRGFREEDKKRNRQSITTYQYPQIWKLNDSSALQRKFVPSTDLNQLYHSAAGQGLLYRWTEHLIFPITSGGGF